MSSLLEGLKSAVVTAKAQVANIIAGCVVPPRLKMTVAILGDIEGVLAHFPKETDRAVLLAKDCCECLAVCVGESENEDTAARIRDVVRNLSRATALCANLVK